MKHFSLAVVILIFSQISNAENLGRQVKVYSDSSGPQFGTVYSYDADKIWMLSISLWGADLLPDLLMRTLSWRLLDSRSGKFISDWATDVNHPSPVMYPGTMVFSWSLDQSKKVMAAIEALANLKLVLSVNHDLSAPVPTHFVDLGSYCVSNPGNFMNLTSGNSGCRIE